MFYDENREEAEMIKHIEYVKGLYDLQREKVENETYIEGLLLDDVVRAVRGIHSWYCIANDFFFEAQREIEGKKKKQEYLSLLKTRIKHDFLNLDDNFEFVKITSYGYESYAQEVAYKGYGKEFAIISRWQVKLRRKI